MKLLIRIVIRITIPFFLLILFASILTTKPYMLLSKGMYQSHEDVYFDHDYAIEHIIGYLNYRYDDLEFGVDENDNTVIMRDTELRHMVDVKNLYTILRVIALSFGVIGVGLSIYLYRKDKVELYNTYKYMYMGPLFFILFVGGYVLIDFGTAFRVFHELFFTNDDWLLYSTDVLIILLPTNFWMISGLIILFLFGLSLGIIHYLNGHYNKGRLPN